MFDAVITDPPSVRGLIKSVCPTASVASVVVFGVVLPLLFPLCEKPLSVNSRSISPVPVIGESIRRYDAVSLSGFDPQIR